MTDIVERLLALAAGEHDDLSIGAEAAEEIERLREAVVAEREACAQAAEGFEKNRDWVPGSLYDTLRREIASAIRARGQGQGGTE